MVPPSVTVLGRNVSCSGLSVAVVFPPVVCESVGGTTDGSTVDPFLAETPARWSGFAARTGVEVKPRRSGRQESSTGRCKAAAGRRCACCSACMRIISTHQLLLTNLLALRLRAVADENEVNKRRYTQNEGLQGGVSDSLREVDSWRHAECDEPAAPFALGIEIPPASHRLNWPVFTMEIDYDIMKNSLVEVHYSYTSPPGAVLPREIFAFHAKRSRMGSPSESKLYK